MVEKTDYCQLTKLAVKDDGAFIELYQAFFRRVYNFVYANTKNAMDADELTNDIFYAVFKNLDKYNDDFYFSTWLFNIVRHMIIDFHRKKNKKKNKLLLRIGKNFLPSLLLNLENLKFSC